MKRLVISLLSIFSIVFATQAATFTVTTNADNGAGSLRQALSDVANTNTGTGGHSIIFNAAMTITLNNSLNLNADPDYNGLTINGFVDGVAGPDVVIRSNNLCGIRGIDINASITGLKIYGLVFQNLEYGIYFNASASATVNGSEIKGCYFGTDLAGSIIQGGICKSGVLLIGVSSATIGGVNTNLPNGAASATNNPEKCVFGGTCQAADNTRYGAIQLQNGSNNVSIVNNHIGVSAIGTTVLPIGNTGNKQPVNQNGISIDKTPSFNTIISGNVISGAYGSGINVFTDASSSGHVITGNIIGLDATGTFGYNTTTPANSFGNQGSGIYMRDVNNVTIGGNSAATRNVISANGGAAHTWPNPNCYTGWNDYNQIGVYIEWSKNVQIKGNYIGTNAAGNATGIGTTNIFGNKSGGIKIVGGSTGASNNTIGGANAGEGNVISGNGYIWGALTAAPCGSLSGITTGHGIVFQYADCKTNSILGNYIGLSADGLSPLGNFTSGIELQGATDNTIGGSTAGARNYICANQFGITLQEDFDVHNTASGNIVSGNYIGLNVNGAAVGNGTSSAFTEGGGIIIQKGANLNTIGSAVAGGGNVISGNRSGVVIRNAEGAGSNTGPARNNTIQNNIIGLDPTGATAISNTSATAGYGYGIQLEVGTGSATTTIPFGNIIGGTSANQGNTISGNQKSGIYVASTAAVTASTANSITGNRIGTNLAGTTDLGNTLQGIEIVNVSRTTILSNVISGNDQNGISLTASSTNTIQNNTIGSNATKLAPIPNRANGILVAAGSASNIIGGIALNEPNFIFYNGANGVVVDGSTSRLNSIHRNSFSCNNGRGIVLSNGGNNSYAAPTILGNTNQITWTGPTSTSYIEVYETDGCATCATGTSDRLQGRTLIASGASPFVFNVAAGFDKSKTYTALAHEANATAAHNSSEFSGCYVLCQDPSAVTISTSTPVTFCDGGSVILTAVITGGLGTPTYQWKNGATNIANATNSTYVATTAGVYTVVYNSDRACTANITSAPTTVTVNPKPVISDNTPSAICSGNAFTVTPTGTGVPAGTTYTWAAPVVTGGITGGSAQATDQASISQTLTNPGTTAGTAVYTVTPKSGAGCIGATFKVTVTVNPKATVTTVDPSAICSGATTAVSLTSGTASSTFAWTIGIASSSVTGYSAGSGASIAQTLTNTGTSAGTVQYIVTPTFGGCAGTLKTITVTVNPVATVTTNDPAAICSGATTAISLTSSTASSTFAWTIGTTSPGVSGYSAGTGTSIAQTLTNNGTGAGTVQYNVIPTFGGCVGTSKTITVTVNPVATVTTNDPAAICSGATTAVSLTSGTASATFAWTLGTVSTGVSGQSAGSGSTIAQTLINNAAGVGAVQYIVTPAFGGCQGTAKTITVLINPVSTVTTTNPAAICSGATTAIGLTSASTSATYSWTIGTVSTGISGQSAGNGSSIAQALTNSESIAGTVEYIITPSVGGCDGTSKTITVTVNPVATVSTSNPAVICSGGTTAITLTSGTTPVTFAWTIGTTSASVSGYAAGNGTSIAQTLVNTSNSNVGTVEYVVVPTFGTCAGTAKTIIASVNPVAVLTTATTSSVCSGSSTNIGLSSSISSATYAWKVGTVSGVAGAVDGNGSVISQNLTTTSPTVAGSVEYLVTASFGSCGGDATKITVTVNPKPVITASADQTALCAAEAQSATLTADASGFTGGTIEWFQGGVSIGFGSPIIVNEAGSYAAVYTAITGTCVSDNSNLISITITPQTSSAIAALDSVTTCLDNILLIAKRPDVGIGAWTIYVPNPALPAELIRIPNRSADSVQAINLVDGISYKFLYTVTSGCGTDQTDTVFVKVGIDDFNLTASAPTDTLCVQTKRTLSAHVIGKGGSKSYNYIWVGSDGSSFTTRDSIIVVNPAVETIDYVVHVEDLIKVGCKTNDVPLQIHAVASQDLNIPNLITPNGDDKNDIFYLADKNNGLPMIKEGSHLEIYNRWGNRVYEANNYDNTWEAKGLSDGIYYYQVKSPCGNKEYKSWLQILGNTNN